MAIVFIKLQFLEKPHLIRTSVSAGDVLTVQDGLFVVSGAAPVVPPRGSTPAAPTTTLSSVLSGWHVVHTFFGRVWSLMSRAYKNAPVRCLKVIALA